MPSAAGRGELPFGSQRSIPDALHHKPCVPGEEPLLPRGLPSSALASGKPLSHLPSPHFPVALERRGQNGAASRMLTDGLGAVALWRSCLKGTSLAELSADCLETANEVLAVGPPPPLGMGWHEPLLILLVEGWGAELRLTVS